MKYIYKHILLLVFFSCSLKGLSFGQDAILSQFYSSPLYLNPAFAGTNADTRLVLNYRNQPFPDANNFSLLSAAIDGYVEAVSGGLGLLVMSDYQGGLLWKNQVNAIYSYHLQLSRDWFVNFGAQAGYYLRDIRWGNLEFTDPAQAPPEADRKHSSNFASGILFFNHRMFGGIAVHHLTQPGESLFNSDINLQRKYTAHFGFMIEPKRNRRANTLLFEYFLSPNIIIQSQGDFHRINYGFYAGIEQLMAGLWYRQDLDNANAMIFLIGISRGNYRIGYSFDYAMSGYADFSHSVHEISLAFDIVNERRRLERKVLRGVGF